MRHTRVDKFERLVILGVLLLVTRVPQEWTKPGLLVVKRRLSGLMLYLAFQQLSPLPLFCGLR